MFNLLITDKTFYPSEEPPLAVYFLDRDPTHFRHILNYLRDIIMVPQLNPSKRNELLAEARFYGVQGLVDALESQALPVAARGRSLKATKCRRRRYK